MQVLASFRGTHASRAKKEVKGLYSLQRYDKKALAGHIWRLKDEDRFLAASQYWNGVCFHSTPLPHLILMLIID